MALNRIAAVLAVAVAGLCACEAQAPAETTNAVPQGSGFDFYVLSLSWSPSYCEIEGGNASRQQCGGAVDHHFVVHGLWPQFERGWPEFCGTDEPDRVPDALVRAYLDIMPSAGLIGHQWRKHGSCSGLTQEGYLAAARAAWERVTVPERYRAPASDMTVDPARLERDFIAANPGLAADGVAVTCEAGFVSEVRLCLTTALDFRACPEVDARACRLRSAAMPAAD